MTENKRCTGKHFWKIRRKNNTRRSLVSKRIQNSQYVKKSSIGYSSSDSDSKTSCFPFFRKSKCGSDLKSRQINKLINPPRAFELIDLEPHPSLRKIFAVTPPKDEDITDFFSEEEEEVGEEETDDIEDDIGSYERVKRAMKLYEEKKAFKKKLEAEYALYPERAPRPKGPPWDDSDDDPAALRPTMVPCASDEILGEEEATPPPRRRRRHFHRHRERGDASGSRPPQGPGPSGEAGRDVVQSRSRSHSGHRAQDCHSSESPDTRV